MRVRWTIQVHNTHNTHLNTHWLIDITQLFLFPFAPPLSPVQCYGETTYCWCVDQDGREVPGTRSNDAVKPACECLTSRDTPLFSVCILNIIDSLFNPPIQASPQWPLPPCGPCPARTSPPRPALTSRCCTLRDRRSGRCLSTGPSSMPLAPKHCSRCM